MKYKLTIATLMFFSFSAKSQLDKGIWLVGGTGKFYSYNSQFSSAAYSSTASLTQIDLSPNIGYFVADKLAFGLKPSLSTLKGKVTTPGGLRTNTIRYAFGPFGRYYFLEKDKGFNILTDVSYQFGTTNLDGKQIGTFSSFSALAGPVVYFNSSVGLEFLLGYSSSLEDKEQAFKETKKGFQIGIGLQIHLEN